MRLADLAPHHAELGVLDFFLGLVDISHPLANVELCVLFGPDAINFQQSTVGVAVGLAALVASVLRLTFTRISWPMLCQVRVRTGKRKEAALAALAQEAQDNSFRIQAHRLLCLLLQVLVQLVPAVSPCLDGISQAS